MLAGTGAVEWRTMTSTGKVTAIGDRSSLQKRSSRRSPTLSPISMAGARQRDHREGREEDVIDADD